MESLRVALGDRAYPIHIGEGILVDSALYAPHLGGGDVVVITDQTVAPLYLDHVGVALKSAGARVSNFVVKPGEEAKSWQTLNSIFDALLKARVGRDALIVALGGGVIGDLAGFAAAIYQRGVPFVQVPTTLLAQVDSSVGGKTAINHPLGKNMIGAFHQPLAVVSDVATLASLPARELRAGIAEVIKHGLALDAAFFDWLEWSIEKLVARDAEALSYAVRRSCELKAQIVAGDERESGARALLNFGHTFGHAIEAASGYGAWLHGEAVAAGMVMAAELSRRQGMIGESDVERVRALIRRGGLPVAGPPIAPEKMLELMAVDKKAAQGKVRFVLLESIGKAVLKGGVEEGAVRKALLAATR
jgi:3-dehydroquinate synthase